ncbi:MAG: NifB/NifX family molybdenum-iron cluster-binding protein [Desulfobacterales bacterium]
MNRIAIPVYKSRVSPVFDSCTRLLLIDLNQNGDIDRKEILFEGLSEIERVKMLKKTGVRTVICGGISDGFYKMISSSEISVIIGIAGEVDQVLNAYRCNRLGEPCFYMPGYYKPAE